MVPFLWCRHGGAISTEGLARTLDRRGFESSIARPVELVSLLIVGGTSGSFGDWEEMWMVDRIDGTWGHTMAKPSSRPSPANGLGRSSRYVD